MNNELTAAQVARVKRRLAPGGVALEAQWGLSATNSGHTSVFLPDSALHTGGSCVMQAWVGSAALVGLMSVQGSVLASRVHIGAPACLPLVLAVLAVDSC